MLSHLSLICALFVHVCAIRVNLCHSHVSVSHVCVCVCLPEVSVFLRQDLSLNLETANYPLRLVTKEPRRSLRLTPHPQLQS